MTDNLHTGTEARRKLVIGINKVSDAVKWTMGTGGSNAIIEVMESPKHMATNDGYTIANSIHLADPIENMGRNILVEAISRANKQSGDGSSTTCLLTAEIISNGLVLGEKDNPMDVKRSLEACIPLIENYVMATSRPIEIDQVSDVATVSSEDRKIGNMIQEIYEKIGRDGIIYWDISKTAEDTYTIGTGITIDDAGYVSPYMCDADGSGQNTNVIRIKDPKILLVKQKITSANDFEAIGAGLFAENIKDLDVFCDDIDPLVVPSLVLTRMQKGFRIAVIKMPLLWRNYWYEDVAKATGATVVDPASGLPLNKATKQHLGTVGHIVINKDQTMLDGIQNVTEHIVHLEADGTEDALLRVSRLNTKTARYFVGAHSDSALSYKRLKVEDAISASWQALNGGVVAGGGVSLRNCSDVMPDTVGGRILAKAFLAPEEQIATNVGTKEYLGLSGDENIGLNTKTGEYVDMFKAGIVDPANIVLNACKNAISVAAAVLTCTTIVTLPRDDKPL